MLSSAACNSVQLKSPSFQQWMGKLGRPSMLMHRKVWEWAFISQALEERGMLQPGRNGLAVAGGKGPLIGLYASLGCNVVAAEADREAASMSAWMAMRPSVASRGAGSIAADDVSRQVFFRVIDMNDFPGELEGFDFVWSSCAMQHLGSIEAASEFLSRSVRCLRPGGLAIHTTEYNFGSGEDTLDHGPTVLFRKSDIDSMVQRLRSEGHTVEPVDYDTGDAADDRVIQSPPYDAQPCLKIWVGPHPTTSLGLIIRAGPRFGNAAPAGEDGHGRRLSDLFDRMRSWAKARTHRGRAAVQPTGSSAMSTDQRATLEDVRYAYRLLLDRVPDPVGLEHYRRLVQTGALGTVRNLVDGILACDEFRRGRSAAGVPIEVEMGGYSMFVRSDDQQIGRAISLSGIYEPHVTSAVKQLLRKGDTFVDVGANIGFFSVLAAHIVGPQGRVIAVEPMDANVQLLYASIRRNGFRHVEVHPFAASDHSGLLPMATGFGTSNAQVMLGLEDSETHALFAQARMLDEMLSGLDRVDLLKIDIEGHELLALKGFADGLARHRPRLLTEFHPKCMRDNSRIDPADYLDFLFGYSRTVQVLHGDGSRIDCAAPTAVMEQWAIADAELKSNGTTHIDLLLEPSRASD
mgnify:CR=1 FL=1